MKRDLMLVTIVALAMTLTVGVAFAGTAPNTGIIKTSHDLSSSNKGPIYGNTTENRVCIFCHAPHHVVKPTDAAIPVDSSGNGFSYLPLWNHDLTQVTTFTMYNSNLTDMPSGAYFQQQSANPAVSFGIGSVSKLCLSCHDGTVAIAAFGNAGGIGSTYAYSPSHMSGTLTITAGSSKNLINSAVGVGLGTKTADLSNHHPIGFDYFAVQSASNGALNSPTTSVQGTPYKIQDLLWHAQYDNTGALSGGSMECSTCHSVHNKNNGGTKFLWVDDNNQSALCLTCHNK